MTHRLFSSFLPATLLFLAGSGCALVDDNTAQGLLFTYTRTPYTRDLHNTPMPDMAANGKILRITEPFSGYGLYTEMNTNAVGDIARAHGLTQVYFADLEILSVLGIWSHHRLYIYGR